MDRPFRLLAALPCYAIGVCIAIVAIAYGLLGELKALQMFIHGDIVGSFIWGSLYPIVAAIIGAAAALFWVIATAIHGEPKPAPTVPAWETYL